MRMPRFVEVEKTQIGPRRRKRTASRSVSEFGKPGGTIVQHTDALSAPDYQLSLPFPFLQHRPPRTRAVRHHHSLNSSACVPVRTKLIASASI
jgi:hypothetical protein